MYKFVWDSKELDDYILKDKSFFSKKEILFELLYNNILLPDY